MPLPAIPEHAPYRDAIIVIDSDVILGHQAIAIMEDHTTHIETKRVCVFLMIVLGIITLIIIGTQHTTYNNVIVVACGIAAMVMILKCYMIATMSILR